MKKTKVMFITFFPVRALGFVANQVTSLFHVSCPFQKFYVLIIMILIQTCLVVDSHVRNTAFRS